MTHKILFAVQMNVFSFSKFSHQHLQILFVITGKHEKGKENVVKRKNGAMT